MVEHRRDFGGPYQRALESEAGGRQVHLSLQGLTITHNFCALRERPKGQVVDHKKGVADNKL